MSDLSPDDFSELRFWIAGSKPVPSESFLALANGGIVNAHPGFWEIANPAPGIDGTYFVMYLIQAGEQSYALATCWDGFAFDIVQEWLIDPVTRTEVGAVIRREWPLFYRLSESGRTGDMASGALIEVTAVDRGQWCVATVFSCRAFERIEQLYEEPAASAAMGMLWELSMKLLRETVNGPLEIPGIVLALGDSDIASRRRTKERIDNVMDVLGHAQDILGMLGG